MAKIRVSISGKNLEITEALRSYVDKKISKLDKYLDDNRTASAEVMLRIERGIHIAEVTVNLSGVLLRARARREICTPPLTVRWTGLSASSTSSRAESGRSTDPR